MKPKITVLFLLFTLVFSARPAFAQLKRVVDVATVLPSTPPTNFLDFNDEVAVVSLDRGQMAFIAKDARNIYGIYVSNGTNITKVVHGDDVEPVTGGSYGGFSDQRIRDGQVAFSTWADANAYCGVYLWNGTSISNIANTNTPVPGGAVGETFASFSQVDVDGGRVVFYGGGDQSPGTLYLWNGSSLQETVASSNNPARPWLIGDELTFIGTPDSIPILVRKNLTSGTVAPLVDTTTPAPGGGNFNTIAEVCATSNHVAFIGNSGVGDGVYLLPDGAGSVVKIAQTGDPLPGITNRTFYSFLNVAVADTSTGARGWFLAGDNFGTKILCQFDYNGNLYLTRVVYELDATPEGELLGMQLPQSGFDGNIGTFVARPQSESAQVLFSIGPYGAMAAPGAYVKATAQYYETGPFEATETGVFNAQAGIAVADTNLFNSSSRSEAEGHAYVDVFNQGPICKARAVASGISDTPTFTSHARNAQVLTTCTAWFRPAGTDPGSNITVNVALSIGGFLESACYTYRTNLWLGSSGYNDAAGEAKVYVAALVLTSSGARQSLFSGGVTLGRTVDLVTWNIELSTEGDWPDPVAHPGNYQIAPSTFPLPGSVTIQTNEIWSAPVDQAWRVAVNRVFTNAVSVDFSEIVGLQLMLMATADGNLESHFDQGRCARSDFFNTVGGAVSTDTPGVHFELIDEQEDTVQPPTTFAEWQARHFTAAQLVDSAYSGTTADPDHDGLPNFLEYAFFHEPRTPDATAIPNGSVTNGSLTLTYPRLRAATDLTITPQVSGGLSGPWQSGPEFIEETIVDPNPSSPTYTVVARDKTSTNAPARFGRLKATHN